MEAKLSYTLDDFVPWGQGYTSLRKRLWSKTKIVNDCWIWTGYKQEGYGFVTVDGRLLRVARLSAHIHHGLDLDDEKQLACHKQECPNRSCWNPDHIYVGTHSDNMQDARIMGTLGQYERDKYHNSNNPSKFLKTHHKDEDGKWKSNL